MTYQRHYAYISGLAIELRKDVLYHQQGIQLPPGWAMPTIWEAILEIA